MIQKLIRRTLSIGVTPEDSDDLRVAKALLNGSTYFVAFVFLFLWAPLYYFFGEPTITILAIIYCLCSFVATLLFHWYPSSFRLVLFFINILGFVMAFVASILLGGFINSSGLIIWLLTAIIGGIIQNGNRYGLFLFSLFTGGLLLLGFLQPYLRPTNSLPDTLTLFILLGNVIGVSIFVFISVSYFIQQRNIAFGLLRGEQEKSENLLLNILPKDIAVILKNESRVIADHYEGASILFADVVNFTPLSATLTPTELVNLLNEVFSYFDTLVEKYGLEKIKTIGDCYMVASGVPRPRADHAQVLTHMALEMQACVNNREFLGRKLAFRIGINSGAVVAGVIGRKKFIYDLWGDAVNTASRMESHGSSGMIQITKATHELIRDQFVCEPRGTVNVKGKGEMDVWSVVRSK